MPKSLNPGVELPPELWPEQPPRPDADTVTRALGGTGLPSEIILAQLDPSSGSGAEALGVNRDKIVEAHDAATQLFGLVNLEVPRLDSPEFESVDWERVLAATRLISALVWSRSS